MDLELIKQYTHKIKKIHIKNTNRYSLRSRVVLKINMNVNDNETIRFSLKENSEFIGHQQKNNDFFIRVPNNLVGYDNKPTITTIYAHFFDKDLYQYEEHQQIFSEFDFSQLKTTDSQNYQLVTDSNKKTAIVRSKLNNSIDGYKNPNYKHYTKSNINDNIIQSHFPISSHYRSNNIYNTAPYLLNQGNDEWVASNSQYPYWEAKIHRNELSPLISNGVENTEEDTPLNVFLNYNYLPTSTEYHEHFFGFEDNLNANNKYLNILEGENLDFVSDKFNSHNNYRIVQLSNIYSDEYSMYVPKGNIIQINLNDFIASSCSLQYNQCYGYYTYKPGDYPGYASKNIQLKKDHIYTLKYYIYIPETMNDEEIAYISVNNEHIHNQFLQQDKILREQWIYHEVPFISHGLDIITIHGPNKIQEDNECYFINVTIEEMVEYSPTIKYNQKGIYLTENDSFVARPLNNNIEAENNTAHTISKQWESPNLPLIHKRVYFIFNRNKNIYYEKNNKILYYMYDNEDDFRITYNSNGDLTMTQDDDILLYVNDAGDMIAEYDTSMIFTRSVGNHFAVSLKDINGNDVNDGVVEAAIHGTKLNEKDDLTEALKYLGQRDVRNSQIEFNGIDLSNLPLKNDEDTIYYLYLKYINPCSDVSFAYETIILQEPQFTLTPIIDNENINIDDIFLVSQNKQLPLKIKCLVTNQLNDIVTGGYVDLSINDHETQSTIVDENGIADFYLDLDDLVMGVQTVKLEYFTKNYHPMKYIYFKINNLIENKPTLPFIVKGIIQENTSLPIDIETYTQELSTITKMQTYTDDFGPIIMNIDIDIPSGVITSPIVLKISRDNKLLQTYTLDYIPTESLIFIDDFNDVDNTDIVKYHTNKEAVTSIYKIELLSNDEYRYNDVEISVSHY